MLLFYCTNGQVVIWISLRWMHIEYEMNELTTLNVKKASIALMSQSNLLKELIRLKQITF